MHHWKMYSGGQDRWQICIEHHFSFLYTFTADMNFSRCNLEELLKSVKLDIKRSVTGNKTAVVGMSMLNTQWA